MRMIKKGEYDLVNISLIGCDPNTGKTYEQCQDEWDAERRDAERDRIVAAWDSLPWWNIWQNIKLRWEIAALYSKRGY